MGSCALRVGDRSVESLEWPSAASLANQSAYLLPATSLWLEIHLMVSIHYVLLAALRRAWIRCCPAAMLGALSEWIIDWLSK